MPTLRWRTLADMFPGGVDHLEATFGAGLLSQLVRDPSGRQSGENSLAIGSPELTDPVPTEWRPCRHAGSRYEQSRPMNVSGLRQLTPDLQGMLGRIAFAREAFLRRTGGAMDLGAQWLLAYALFVLPRGSCARTASRTAPCRSGRRRSRRRSEACA